jgi:PAS domain-containing protein
MPILLIDFSSWNWYDWVVAITAFVITAGGFFKAITDIRENGWERFRDRWVRPWRAKRLLLEALNDTVGDINSKLARIDSELRTNGGYSVKDVVCRIDRKVEHLQARARYQDETSELPTFELDAAGNMRVTNCAFRELVNADENELEHRNYISRTHRDDKSQFLREIREAIENKMPIDSTVRFRISNTQFVTVRFQALPDVRRGGDLIGFFGSVSPIVVHGPES